MPTGWCVWGTGGKGALLGGARGRVERSQSWGYMGQARELDFHPPAVRAGESFKQRHSSVPFVLKCSLWQVCGGWVERGETGRKVYVTHFNPPARLHPH